MRTATFLRTIAAAIEAGCPAPIGITPPLPGSPGRVQVRHHDIDPWTAHLNIPLGRWDGDYYRSSPGPGTDICITAIRPLRAPAGRVAPL